jgi:amidase
MKHLSNLLNSTDEPLVRSVENMGLLTLGSPKTLEEYYSLCARRQDIEKTYLQIWQANRLDAIIMPPAPHTAIPLDSWSSVSYTAIWNLLDYPAVVIPVGKVCSLDKVDEISNAKYGDADKHLYQNCENKRSTVRYHFIVNG